MCDECKADAATVNALRAEAGLEKVPDEGEIKIALRRLINAISANDEACGMFIAAVSPVLSPLAADSSDPGSTVKADMSDIAAMLHEQAARLEAINYHVWNAKSRVEL